MGTRSLTFVRDALFGDKPKPCVCMYRQMDGYPSGHGQELVDFLKAFDIVNGISLSKPKRKIANGGGCLAAQMVAHFKDGPGGIYLHPPGEFNAADSGIDYVYDVTVKAEEPIKLKVSEVQYGKGLKKIYEGGVTGVGFNVTDNQPKEST